MLPLHGHRTIAELMNLTVNSSRGYTAQQRCVVNADVQFSGTEIAGLDAGNLQNSVALLNLFVIEKIQT
jgi:hypothetical protein